MYKVEKVKSFLDCEQCNQVDPVLMAYGKFICKIHLERLLTHKSKEKKNFYLLNLSRGAFYSKEWFCGF